jgi:hypothetical protein
VAGKPPRLKKQSLPQSRSRLGSKLSAAQRRVCDHHLTISRASYSVQRVLTIDFRQRSFGPLNQGLQVEQSYAQINAGQNMEQRFGNAEASDGGFLFQGQRQRTAPHPS